MYLCSDVIHSNAGLPVEEDVSFGVEDDRRFHFSDEAVVKLVPLLVDWVEGVSCVVSAAGRTVMTHNTRQVIFCLLINENKIEVLSTLYVHKAHHTVFKTQRLVSGHYETNSQSKTTNFVLLFVIGWYFHVDQSQGAGLENRVMGFVYCAAVAVEHCTIFLLPDVISTFEMQS